jgi:hypothetical protein
MVAVGHRRVASLFGNSRWRRRSFVSYQADVAFNTQYLCVFKAV